MKVLLIGRGVISGITGWALEQAGHEVEFLVRSGRAAQYGSVLELDLLDGRRRAGRQRVRRSWPVRFRETLERGHDHDLLVVSVAHTRLEETMASLAPVVGAATVLVLGNVWGEPADLAGGVPLDQVVWGFPQAGGGFDADGVLRGALLGSVVIGTLDGAPNERGLAVRRLLRDAGLRIREQPDMRGWLRLHVLADAGMHAQGLRLGSMSRMIGRPEAFRQALLTTRELLPLVAPYRRGTFLFRGPSRPLALLMSTAVRRVAIARRSIEAHDDPEAEEPRAVVRDVLAEVRRRELRARRLEAAEASLR